MSEPRDHEDEPRVGQPLPKATNAHIDLDKLVHYALDPGHPAGRHKARVFRAALAIEQRDAQYLRDAILRELPRCAVTGMRLPKRPEQRLTWEVQVPITGLNDRQLIVITAWEMIDQRPELISARVAPKRRRRGVD